MTSAAAREILNAPRLLPHRRCYTMISLSCWGGQAHFEGGSWTRLSSLTTKNTSLETIRPVQCCRMKTLTNEAELWLSLWSMHALSITSARAMIKKISPKLLRTWKWDFWHRKTLLNVQIVFFKLCPSMLSMTIQLFNSVKNSECMKPYCTPL